MDEELRAGALAALAPRLSERLLTAGVEAAKRIAVAGYRARALAALAPHLSEPARTKAMADALAAAGHRRGFRPVGEVTGDERARAAALTTLAPHLPESLLADALAAAAAREMYGEERAAALAALAPHLPERLFAAALTAARGLSEEGRFRVLAAMAPRLPEPLSDDAIAAARRIGYAVGGAEALAALVALASRLPEPTRGEALAEALAAGGGSADERRRAEALAALAPHLPEPLLAAALAAARDIQGADERAAALAALAPPLAALPPDRRYRLWRETLRALALRSQRSARRCFRYGPCHRRARFDRGRRGGRSGHSRSRTVVVLTRTSGRTAPRAGPNSGQVQSGPRPLIAVGCLGFRPSLEHGLQGRPSRTHWPPRRCVAANLLLGDPVLYSKNVPSGPIPRVKVNQRRTSRRSQGWS